MFDVKPLRWSFILSLPFLVAAIWIVFLVLAAVERNQRNAELNALVTQGSVEEATLAIRRMSYLSNPPLDLVVAATNSPSQTVAREAQLAINDLLRRWQRQISAGRNLRRVAGQLNELSAALDERRNSFATKDYPWLAKTAARIVRMANRASPDGAPGLAVHCDSLLAFASAPVAVATRPVSLNAVDLVPSTLDTAQEFADVTNEAGPAIAVTPLGVAPAAPLPEGVFTSPRRTALQAIVATGDPVNDASPTEPSVDWRGQWMRPLLTAVGLTPPLPPASAVSPRSLEFVSPPGTNPSSLDVDTSWGESAESVPTRTLLRRWLTADVSAAGSIERELAQRGFGTLSPNLVRQVVTDVVEDRVQLVADVIITPGVDAKPWLLLMADDASSDVRLAAVTVMATSTDPALIEKAWQVALHDRDPRLSALAERLRDRRASLGRR